MEQAISLHNHRPSGRTIPTEPLDWMIGTRSGKLVVVATVEERGFNGARMVLCHCDCGGKTTQRATAVKRQMVKTCEACRHTINVRWTPARKAAFPALWRSRATPTEIVAALNAIDAHFPPLMASGLAHAARMEGLGPRPSFEAVPRTKYVPPPPVPMPRPFKGAAKNRRQARELATWLLSSVKDLSDVDVAGIAQKSGLTRFCSESTDFAPAHAEVRVAIGRVRAIRHGVTVANFEQEYAA